MAREMKDSGIEWIGAIPNNWNCIDCKYIFKNEKKIVGPRENEYERLALTLNGVVKRSKDDSTGLQTERFDSYQILLPCELVFKMLDLKNISTSRVGFSPYKGIVSPAYIILKTEKNNVSKFFYYYFYNMWQRTIFNQMGNSGVRSSLTASDMLNLPVIVPDIHEQKNIANYLDKQCSEIDLLTADIEKQISVLEDYKKSIITEAVTKGLDPNVEMKDSGVEWIGRIPKHWNNQRLKDLFLFGKGLSITKADLTESGAPVVSYGQIHSKLNVFTFIKDELIRFVPLKKCEFYANSKCSIGDFIFADTSEDVDGCGNFIYVDKDCIYAGYHTIVLKSLNLPAKFFAYLFQSDEWRSQIRTRASGIKVFSITQKIISNCSVITPPKSEQDEIVSFLDNKCSEIDSLILEKKSQLEKLAAYKQSMIYEYVTGKKEVPSKEIA